MKRLLWFLPALALTACVSVAQPPPAPASSLGTPSIPGLPTHLWTWPPTATCGHERWAVKTATDPGARQIGSHVFSTTISKLTAWPAPASLPPTRITPVETTIWRVHATLTGFKLEADSDYHLILSDGSHTMIAEIPDPPCAKGSTLLGGIERARSEFDARYTPSALTFTHVSVPVVVTGVGFFDSAHGQTGVAPNEIELHPVLNISFG